jgi:tRNA wybutosine-synthesizing protein 3
MVRDNFLQRKKDILSKLDKSSIGDWDEQIKSLCEKINKSDDFYTTSSCSGRIIIMIDQDKKAPGLFEFVSHRLIELKDIVRGIPKEQAKLDLKFKSEPPIIHIACRTLEGAESILRKAMNTGWKRSGIISMGKNIVVELISTEKIEFPLVKKGKVLVNDEFLEIVIERANNNLKKGWNKIKELKKIM